MDINRLQNSLSFPSIPNRTEGAQNQNPDGKKRLTKKNLSSANPTSPIDNQFLHSITNSDSQTSNGQGTMRATEKKRLIRIDASTETPEVVTEEFQGIGYKEPIKSELEEKNLANPGIGSSEAGHVTRKKLPPPPSKNLFRVTFTNLDSQNTQSGKNGITFDEITKRARPEDIKNLFAEYVGKTEIKKARTGQFRINAEKVLSIMNSEGEKELTYQNCTFKVLNKVGEGEYMHVYAIESEAPLIERYIDNESEAPILETYTHEQLLLKYFHGEKGNYSHNFDSYFNAVSAQYKQLLMVKYPIAEILNLDTADTDGYFLVENIPYEFVMNWDRGTLIHDLDQKTLGKLKQLKDMFQKAFDHKIDVDLFSRNLRVKEDGTIVLVDFREESDEDDDKPYITYMHSSLEHFSNWNKEILQYLTPEGFPSAQ